jgi:hypothetical protein
MHQQEINLYQPLLRKEVDWLSGKNILNISGMALTGFLLIYGVFYWHVGDVRSELESLQVKQKQMTERLAEVSKTLQPKRKSAVLESQVKVVSIEVEVKRKILATISDIPQISSKGFAGFLEGMARQHIKGLWLTGFKISDGGNEMNISGRSLDPALVPAYLKKLSHEQVFHGIDFETFRMNRAKKEVALIDFMLLSNGQSGAQ